MIGWEDVYKVVVAMVPLYVALVLGYGSVRWWKIFTPEQCGAVNKFVCFFTLPLFTFEFTAHVDPFKMNYLFIGADAISKLIIVVVLGFWANCSSKGSYTWSITSFSLCSLTNSLVVGVPLMKAMYGQMAVDLVVQSSVIQSIIWLTVLLFVLEFRRSRLDVSSCNNTDTDNLQKDLEGSNCSVDHNNSNRPASFWVLMKVVWIKLAMNPNLYACIIALFWAFISNRWHFEMPSIMEGSVLIMSKAGTGTAMFSMGIFMALQEKFIACGTGLTVMGMVLRFIVGPAAMAIGCIAVGLHGDVLRVAIIQAALPQSITSFIFAKEYGLHAEVLSTAGFLLPPTPTEETCFLWRRIRRLNRASLLHETSGRHWVSWNMKSINNTGPLPVDPKSRKSCFCSFLPAASFLFLVFFTGSAFIVPDYKEKLSRWRIVDSFQNLKFVTCKNQCGPPGSEALPEGIVSKTSNLEMRPLWGFPKSKENSSSNLFTLAVGIKQRDIVDEMVKKFLSSNFTVMLFHYDGVVDEWKDYKWNDHVIHVSARNQTKWWFAKRFLHPDIVAEYNYIFLWDEDLGVKNFNPKRYVSIAESKGLEISQPALDMAKSEIHQQITARVRKSIVHRWVEMMAPVFSKAAWRCVWYMIQGDRIKNIGVVDAEYIVHYGRPTLGGTDENKESSHSNKGDRKLGEPSHSNKKDPRLEVRRQSFIEFKIFHKRWEKAAAEDKCWVDPYKEADKQSIPSFHLAGRAV
ncbi:hypothetical protein MANES_09G184701v8 [Manihot esculenta]|uniref:Uncharacterized protein n=1 Tax=Manihot esculenta TaxID=3983 RepID=A0ACB7H6N1_MANES|nr:hypothetical protein MANES_09G184701v8 [Manihot esculenta]